MTEHRHCIASEPDPVAGMAPVELTGMRRGTHGEWAKQSSTEQKLKAVLRDGEAWSDMTPSQCAAVEMIAVKLSRIVNGNPHYADHWQDIGGYALLGENGGHNKAVPINLPAPAK